MRHILLAQPVTAASFGMLEAASSALLVAPAGFLDASAACGLRAASGTIDLAPIAAAADDDLGSAVMAQEESAGGFPLAVPVTPMSYRQGEAARGILSLHPCSARCGARHRCELCGFGRCRARSSWRALFTASRTGLSSPRGPLGRSAASFPSGRRAAGGRVSSRPSGSFRHAPLPHHRWPNRPQHPDSSRPRTIPRRQPPLRLAANYRHFLTAIDTWSAEPRGETSFRRPFGRRWNPWS
jgi:hypothetical protein